MIPTCGYNKYKFILTVNFVESKIIRQKILKIVIIACNGNSWSSGYIYIFSCVRCIMVKHLHF